MNSAILLAAGKGSRMRTSIPKCAVTILGKPMILYLVETLEQLTMDQIICVVGYQKERIQDVLGDRVHYALQSNPLGTGDAVKQAIPYLDDSGYTLIMSGDTPLLSLELLKGLIQKHIEGHHALTITTTFLKNPFGYGRIIRNNANEPVDILEEQEATAIQKAIREVNVGLYCIENQALKRTISKLKPHASKEYYLTDFVKLLAKNGGVDAYLVDATYEIQGMNDLSSLAHTEEAFRKAIVEKHLQQGVRIIQPSITTIGNDVEIEEGAVIEAGSILLGTCHIGKEAVIGPYTTLYQSVVEEGAHCRYSVIEDSVIGHHSEIGPFAHIRKNCMVGPYNRIGNFVELKNTTTKEQTKVAHLAYLGDTSCGARVNWGCGSITVNYDGKQKNQTVVGDDVFIGCNSNLIAPIELKNGSYIAAGSTITDSLEQQDFAIARSKQLTKKKYAVKYSLCKKNETEAM